MEAKVVKYYMENIERLYERIKKLEELKGANEVYMNIVDSYEKERHDVVEYLKKEKEKYNGVYEEITKEMVIEDFNKIIEMIERNK